MKKKVPILIILLALVMGTFGVTSASAAPRAIEVDYDE